MMQSVDSLVPDISLQINQEQQEKAANKKPATTIALTSPCAPPAGDGKSNEIWAVQELLPLLKIKDYMVTTDAMNCQIDTAQVIIDAKADYLLHVKNNQPALKTDIEHYVQDKTLRIGMESYTKEEKGHRRKKVRTAYICDDAIWQTG